MDSINSKKVRTTKSGKKNNIKSQFLYSLFVHSVVALVCSLLCSYSYWFPSLYTIKHLLCISLPSSCSGLFNPGCLFVVVNFIVVFLIGESRMSGQQPCPASEMYSEYVERSRRMRRSVRKEGKKVEVLMNVEEDNVNRLIDDKEVIKEDKTNNLLIIHDEDFKECDEAHDEVQKDDDQEEEIEEKKGDEAEKEEDGGEEKEDEVEKQVGGGGEKEVAMPAEELNKRVEDFIARVNKQRWLEARLSACC